MTTTITTAAQELLTNSPVKGHEGQCLICYSSLDYPTITPCNHNEVCGTCHLRLRFLHNDIKCPICKQANQQIICDYSQQAKTFEEYPLWGNELGENFKYRQDVGMFFPTAYYESEIEPLFGYQCLDCNEYDGTTPDINIYEQSNPQQKNKRKKPPTPLRALQDHLRNKHGLTLCNLCVDHKRDFISQLPRFTPAQLKHHQNHGDGQGSRGHPVCEFCRPKRFYDLQELHAHLNRHHYKCHVCEKQGLENQYFRNYNSLEKHFETQHYLCGDAQCRAARFVVFENEIDLRAHEISTHGASSGSTKIQLEFRYKRSNEVQSQLHQEVPSDADFQFGVDGQAFVPEQLPDDVNTQGAPSEELSHPMHLQRTNELRAHAARTREQLEMENAPEAFPSLGATSESSVDGASSNSASLRVGWTSDRLQGRTQATRQENFPSLPTTPSSSNKKKSSVKRTVAGATKSNRTFAAMQNAAAQAPGWTSAAAAAAAPPMSQSSSFPSLTSATTTSARSTAAPPSSLNRESNLTSENFPSLGGSTSTARYPAAESLARRKAPPSFSSSASDFPPPPSTKPSVRQQVLAPPKKPPPPAVDNILDFPPPPSSKEVTVDEIKATLGTLKYKQLKKLTKEFAADSLAPDAYVDHAASLFERGYADDDFWIFLPTLLSGCPNTASATKAQRYMENVRRNHNQQSSVTTANASLSSAAGWSNKPPKVIAAAAAPSRTTTAAPCWSATSAPSSARAKPAKSAWSASASSTVARAKQKPGSVSAAAAAPSTNSGRATKFMAQEAKKAKKQEAKKAKKKQNDELRALAFGGK